ncbi:eCIS core domain-containing protein [Paracoccus marinaquae]|uniref:DUF4157 domain-containing protein n=1 Tax=Paracoccus marinaquae TaxID=2841926 RepID=A0ABS6AHM9_9RHOB|nr:DUF4157 domain-containing protein [Paracoccus marinaquae]MBU3030107.1 DUF4157 domain-containing protein [Paracoccus marinaquae]
MAQIFTSERAKSAPAGRVGGGQRDHDIDSADRLDAMQFRADQSPATQRLAQLQALGDGRALQRAGPDEEDLMQGRFGTAADPVQRQEDEEMLQAKPASSGGLPEGLQQSMQMMSGADLSGVQVHYNSAAPAQVGAHAFAQGNDIHLASGQERHLPHEAWHVVQQQQGRVQPTTQIGDVAVNDSPSLEAEADRMGEQAARSGNG